MEIREMPLGTVTELVQLSLHRHLLKYHKTQVSSMSPEDIHAHNSTSNEDFPTSPGPDGADEGIDMDPVEHDRTRLVGITFVWPYIGKSVLVTGIYHQINNQTNKHNTN